MLQAGFSEIDVTPPVGGRMGRLFISVLKTEGVKWPLFARMAVFDDGNNRVGIVGLDQSFLLPPAVAELRETIASATELEPTEVMVACSHTHNGPSTMRLLHDEEGVGFANLDRLKDRLASGMQQALAARRPVRLRVGHIDAPGLTFNRRPIYRTDIGEEVGTQGPQWVDDFLRMEGPADDEVKVLLAENEAGEPVGGVVNFACHPTTMYSVPVWSADFIGPLTDALKETYGCVFVFLQGASGNLWSIDMSQRDAVRAPGPERALKMGTTLAAKASEALAAGSYSAGTEVGMARQVLRIPQRRPTREQVRLARWYLDEAKPGVDQVAFTRKIYGHTYTMYRNSPSFTEWFCREMIGMWEWQQRQGVREPSEQVEIQAMRVGDVAFVGYPCEYFTEFGLRTKAESPFAQTFVAELANGWHSYIPTKEGFGHGGYEARFGFPSRLVPEAGDLMCDTALDLLRELAGK